MGTGKVGTPLKQHRKPPNDKKLEKAKNPPAVSLGKLGASKGGRAREKSLSAKERKEIAIRAAIARWKANKRG